MILHSLVATAQEQDKRLAALREVNAAARPIIDTQLAHPGADGSHIPRISQREALDPDVDPGSRLLVAERGELSREDFGLANRRYHNIL